MELLEKYLQAVKHWLPKAEREDIAAKLSDDLRAQVREQEAQRGRRLDQSEIESILKRKGHPMWVAEKYLPQRYLIGPALFPGYRLILKIVLSILTVTFLVDWIYAVLAPGIRGMSHGSAAFETARWLWQLFLYQFALTGGITLVFAFSERAQLQAKEKNMWDPRHPERMPSMAKEPSGDLLNRYLHTIRQSLLLLAKPKRDDILAEIEEDIRSQMEDKEETLGRSLGEEELMAILRRHGHPLLVVGRHYSVALFGASENRYRGLVFGVELIGPELFPLYLLAVCLISGAAFAVTALVALLAGVSITLQPAAFYFVLITLLFCVLNLYAKSSMVESWSPRILYPVPAVQRATRRRNKIPNRIPRFDSIVQMAANLIFLGWWIDVSHFSITSELARVGIHAPWDGLSLWRNFHRTFYLPVIVLLLASISLSAVNLFQPYWTRLRLAARAGIGAVVVAILLLPVAAHWTEAKILFLKMIGPNAPTGDAEVLGAWLRLSIFISFAGVAFGNAIQVIVDVVRMILWKPTTTDQAPLAS